MCLDDDVIKELIPSLSRAVITYGFDDMADFKISGLVEDETGSTFTVTLPNGDALPIHLNMPGKHNVLNAAAAIAVGIDEDIAPEFIQKGLAEFTGVGRRFQIYGEYPIESGEVTLVDDYGHHPTEVRATIDAARQRFKNKRLVMIFQPHRYSRTKDLYDDFVEVLDEVDCLILLDVYSAGEKTIVGADSKSLSFSIRQLGGVDPVHVKNIEDVKPILKKLLKPDDVVLTQGAGNVGTLAELLASDGII